MNKFKLPPYDNFPIIFDSKVLLRQVLLSDIKDLVEISFYDAVQAVSIEQALNMQNKINQDYMNGHSIHWAVTDQATNKVVGTCGYYRGLNEGNGELGCVLLPEWRGKGFMTPAMKLTIRFGLHTMGLNRIWAVTGNQNADALKLLARLDFMKVADLPGNEVAYELRIKPS
ncbi:MAG: GNAT family N-acetyltransferase [Chitinophagaceae bacterium]|jgi:ribosomal-protein-alanine N-acetyltransferase|nr:GNAT family N-acetyltransferase [Chitinophagaceae bacterium]